MIYDVYILFCISHSINIIQCHCILDIFILRVHTSYIWKCWIFWITPHFVFRFWQPCFCFKGLCRPPTGQIDIVHQVEVGSSGAGWCREGVFWWWKWLYQYCFGEKILTLKWKHFIDSSTSEHSIVNLDIPGQKSCNMFGSQDLFVCWQLWWLVGCFHTRKNTSQAKKKKNNIGSKKLGGS